MEIKTSTLSNTWVTESNYNDLFVQSPTPIAIYSGQDLVYTFVNEAYSKIFNHRPLLGKTVREAFPESEGQPFYEILENVYKTGVPYYRTEMPASVNTNNDGIVSVRYYNIVYTAYKNNADKVEGVMAMGHDVTDQVVARAKIEESEDRLRMVIESAGMGSWEYDPATKIIYCSDRTKELFGFKQVNDVTLEMAMNVIVTKDRDKVAKAMKDALQPGSGGDYEIEYSLINSYDKRERSVKTRGKVFFENGSPQKFIGTIIDITQEVLAREEQQKLMTLVENAADFMALADWNGNLIYLNSSGRKLVGLALEQDVSKLQVKEFYTDEHYTRIRTTVLPALANHESWAGTIYLRHFITKEIIPCHGDFIAVKDPLSGKIIGRCVTIRDLRAELTAHVKQQKLLALVDNSVELMSILEMNGKNSYINRAGMQMLGFENEQQVLETPISDLHAEEDILFVRENVIPAVINEGHWSGSMIVRHLKTGEKFPVYNNTVRIDDPVTGKAIAIGAVMRDMRPELASQKALAESEKNLRTLIMQAPLAIGILRGEELKVELANDKYFEVTGKRNDEVLDRSLLSLTDERVNLDEISKEVFHSGMSFYQKEYEVRLQSNGEEDIMYKDLIFHPLKDIAGHVNGILHIVIDVTDKVVARKKIEESEKELQRRVKERTEELEKKNSELERFAYAASHDMQEPLRKVQIFSNLLLENNLGRLDEKSNIYLNKISGSVSRMKTLIDDLLNYSNQTKESRQFVDTDLNIILQNIEVDLDLLIEQSKATITKESLPVVSAIPSQINQLFYNLINNAIKFAKNEVPAEISIRVRDLTPEEVKERSNLDPSNKYIAISFSDNGIGFEQQYAYQIFSLFTRLHGKSEFSGTGIGLALCKKIVENHGGDIYAISEVGKGATFHVILPA